MTGNNSNRIDKAIEDNRILQTLFVKKYGEDGLADKEIGDGLKIATVEQEELEQYRAIGTAEEVKRMQKYSVLAKKHDTIGKVIESCVEYEAIGTVEECREAREKQQSKSPDVWGDGYSDGEMVYDMYDCPGCGESYEIEGGKYNFCPNCGQALNWGA